MTSFINYISRPILRIDFAIFFVFVVGIEFVAIVVSIRTTISRSSAAVIVLIVFFVVEAN